MAKKYFISDFLKRFKRPIELEAEKDYKLVTISSKHRGIKLRHLKKGGLIKSRMYEVKEGDFVLSGIDARNGAFGIIPKELDGAIITNDFWCLEINEDIISKELFLELTATTWFDELCNRGSDGTTNRVRLQKNKFFNQEVILPLKKEQDKLLNTILRIKNNRLILRNELQTQKHLISQLKQSILQEAIQGKLTQEWREQKPNIEPASELLKRIKTEKEKLIKAKKLKKEKPLPPITNEEIPFEIPESWVWCRFNDIVNFQIGKTPASKHIEYWNGTINWLNIGDMIDGGYITTTSKKITEKAKEDVFKTQGIVEPNTLLMSFKLTVGKISINKIPLFHNEAIISIFPYLNIQQQFLFHILPLVMEFSVSKKVLMGQTFNSTSLVNMMFPLPPLAEQKAIVEKVDALMEKCDALEQEVLKSEKYANMLMQAVLKEAFENKAEQRETKVVKLNAKPTNIDYYKRTLLATEIVWQLHKEPTLGHLKLQKLMYLAQESGNMQLPTNFLQQVAGPYDPKMARSLDKQMKIKKWFEYKKTELLKFKPLEKAGEHRSDFQKFFANEMENIQYIIDLFKKAKSDQVEIVGTLYACWSKLIEEKQIVSDELLTRRFYEWSEEKAKFEKNRILKALRWMEMKGIVPKYANA